MKKLITIFCFLVVISSFSQTSFDTTAAVNNLKVAADSMKQSILDKNYAAFTNYVHPKIIAMAGGRDTLILLTKKSFGQLEAQGYTISNITNDDPSQIITEGNLLQSLLPEEFELKAKNGHLLTKSYMLAISDDNGRTWKFIDTSNKTFDQLKGIFPSLSSKINIPKRESPVFFND